MSNLEKEVLRVGKQIDKMVAGGEEDHTQALDLLQVLKAKKITLDVLQKTRIGMSVNNLRKKTSNDEVITLAKSLIKGWKKLLPSDNKNNGTSTAKEEPDGKKGVNQDEDTRKDEGTGRPANTSTVAGEDTVRAKCKTMLANALKMPFDEDAFPELDKSKFQDPEELAAEIEDYLSIRIMRPDKAVCAKVCSENAALKNAIFALNYGPPGTFRDMIVTDGVFKTLCVRVCTSKEKYIFDTCYEGIYTEFVRIDMKYKNRVRSRVSNLQDQKNPLLRLAVLKREIEPERIAKMGAEEMASQEMKALRNNFTKEAINEHQMAMTGGTKSSLMKCFKCGKKNCTYNQVQTRSADEPMTTFVFCNECGNRWKFC